MSCGTVFDIPHQLCTHPRTLRQLAIFLHSFCSDLVKSALQVINIGSIPTVPLSKWPLGFRRSQGCLEHGCELCAQNPSRRCADNFSGKYLSGDALSARCGAPIRLEVIDRMTGEAINDDALANIQVEVCAHTCAPSFDHMTEAAVHSPTRNFSSQSSTETQAELPKEACLSSGFTSRLNFTARFFLRSCVSWTGACMTTQLAMARQLWTRHACCRTIQGVRFWFLGRVQRARATLPACLCFSP